MNAFSVDKAAHAEIQRIFLQSRCSDPVARLYEKADASHLFEELRTETLKGEKSGEELRAMGRSQFERVAGQLKSSLMIGADERANFRPEDIGEIGGIPFAMGEKVFEMLSGCRLTFEDDCFVLRDAKNVSQTLRSLARNM